MTDYEKLCAELKALTDGVPHRIANLANASALIYYSLEDLNWAGFYFMEGGRLVLGPFQGKPACIEIPVGRGVCGAAVQEGKTQLVPDVHLFPGHIACDSASNSEIVVPLRVDGKIVGVLDIDSPWPGRFTEEDQTGLEAVAEIIAQMLTRC
jgi:GAF domain-containing protein